MLSEFYKGKKVLITGHTGFKGSWLSMMLNEIGAQVYGYSLEPPTEPSLFEIADIEKIVDSEIGDIRDYAHLKDYFEEIAPDIVFHLAAQPLVIDGYSNPRCTYETNVMGTVNVLECVRQCGSVRSVVNVTTDKVYENNDTDKRYRETDNLDGYDPYSNSKSCSELVTHCYRKSFLSKCPTSTARAGNVIGGGDFSSNRILPDCIRSAIDNETIKIRNPDSIRPFQHVLEPLYAYVKIAEMQWNDPDKSGYYNIGPNPEDCVTVKKLADLFCSKWGNNLRWDAVDYNGPHEANYLKLDNTKIRTEMGIEPKWNIEIAIDRTVEWVKEWKYNDNAIGCMRKQIRGYCEGYE